MDWLSTAIDRDIAGRNVAIVPWSNRLVGRLVVTEVLQQVGRPAEQLAGWQVEASAGRRVVEWLLEDRAAPPYMELATVSWIGNVFLVPCCFRLIEFGIAASTGHHQTKSQCNENHAGNDA